MHKAGEYIYLFTYSDEASLHDPGMYSSILVNYVCVYNGVLKISVTFLLHSPITPTLAMRYLYTQ